MICYDGTLSHGLSRLQTMVLSVLIRYLPLKTYQRYLGLRAIPKTHNLRLTSLPCGALKNHMTFDIIFFHSLSPFILCRACIRPQCQHVFHRT